MLIEQLIARLQGIATENPGAEVVVGVDYGERLESPIDSVSFQDGDEEDGDEARVVIFAVPGR